MTALLMFPPRLPDKGDRALARALAQGCTLLLAQACFLLFPGWGPVPPPPPPPPDPAAPTKQGEQGAGRPPSPGLACLQWVAVDTRAVLCALFLASICTPVTAQTAPSPMPTSHTYPDDLSQAAVVTAQDEVECFNTQLAALEQQLADLSALFVPPPCYLSPVQSTCATHTVSLPRVYRWLLVGTARVLVLCLIDSGEYT